MTCITGVILARNEERDIVRLLEAIQPLVDEILVNDRESTDSLRDSGSSDLSRAEFGHDSDYLTGENSR